MLTNEDLQVLLKMALNTVRAREQTIQKLNDLVADMERTSEVRENIGHLDMKVKTESTVGTSRIL